MTYNLRWREYTEVKYHAHLINLGLVASRQLSMQHRAHLDNHYLRLRLRLRGQGPAVNLHILYRLFDFFSLGVIARYAGTKQFLHQVINAC